jgi:hypothetical protein
MYSDELPASPVQQVAKIRDRALLAVGEPHHLCAVAIKRKGLSAWQCYIILPLLTMTSVLYAIDDARPKLGSSGLCGTGTSAPGISCVAGSSQAQAISCSTMMSWVLGAAPTRRCFSMERQ